MGIRDVLEEIMKNYIDKKSEKFNKENSMFQLVNYKTKEILNRIIGARERTIELEVKGSCGAGGWTNYPWIAIFNPKVTKTIQAGVYIVYLFSEDMKRVYITLNQGCTNLKKELGAKAARIEMHKVRDHIRESYHLDDFRTDNNLLIGNEDYEEGCIFYKKYEIDNLPDETQMKNDLENLISVYNDYYYREVLSSENYNGGEGDLIMGKNESSATRLIEHINLYVNDKGFIYSNEALSNFYLSLKTKPFVILAGISGTGKSKLVKLFAEAIGATSTNEQYNLISVKPDWNDSTELLGYKNIKDEFVPGKLLQIIQQAQRDENKDKPYFVCLDEMNLARVEYYLSEYLSIIETREFNEDGEIVTDKIFSDKYLGDSENNKEYRGLIFPENLYIIGTVNMDDTTFSFSRKVLDRANTIEFSDVDLELLELKQGDSEALQVDNSFLRTRCLNIKDALEVNADYVKEVNTKIIEINNILKHDSKHFAYRVRDEIVFYMLENKLSALLEEDVAFDYQIKQKILPTIIGSDECIKDILFKLYKYCVPEVDLNPDVDYVEESRKYLDKAKYKQSAEKISMMLRGYRDGYTSFWI